MIQALREARKVVERRREAEFLLRSWAEAHNARDQLVRAAIAAGISHRRCTSSLASPAAPSTASWRTSLLERTRCGPGGQEPRSHFVRRRRLPTCGDPRVWRRGGNWRQLGGRGLDGWVETSRRTDRRSESRRGSRSVDYAHDGGVSVARWSHQGSGSPCQNCGKSRIAEGATSVLSAPPAAGSVTISRTSPG